MPCDCGEGLPILSYALRIAQPPSGSVLAKQLPVSPQIFPVIR